MKVSSKITKETMTNRYGDEFVFTLLEDGNIQWEGKFEYCRFGMPNDYSKAYSKYLEYGGKSSLEDFIDEVHEQIYDDDGHFIGYSQTSQDYGRYVTSDKSTINMVDPSGGPYLTDGMKIMGKTIKEFKPNKKGYLIITQ